MRGDLVERQSLEHTERAFAQPGVGQDLDAAPLSERGGRQPGAREFQARDRVARAAFELDADGLITAWREYFDTYDLSRQTGARFSRKAPMPSAASSVPIISPM